MHWRNHTAKIHLFTAVLTVLVFGTDAEVSQARPVERTVCTWSGAVVILPLSRPSSAAARAQTPSLLKGLIFGPTGRAMTPAHTRKRGKLYRYYVSTDVLKRDADACSVQRIPAAEIESAVIEQVRGLLRSPEIIVRTWRVARKSLEGLSEADVREALHRLDPLWDELFPAEQARVVQLLVERIDIGTMRTEGLTKLVADLGAIKPEARRAA